jgi:hypothetical protein
MQGIDKISAIDAVNSAISQGVTSAEAVRAHGYYTATCFDADGKELWQEHMFPNLVTTVGKNDLLDKYMAGSAYTAALYIGLIGATSYTTGANAADTMASHTGWVEDQNYSQANRPTTAWSAAAAGSKALSAALVFSINATTTIKGCFMTTVNTKGGTTGILYSAGLFTGGDQPAVNGNTLNVSYTAGA